MELLPVFKADENGEQVANIKYLPGSPRQIRFDAKAGSFNVNGKEPLGSTLSFQPFAWEIFTADILNMGCKTWAELYFLDEKNRVCAILFHGHSVKNLRQLIEPLFYDDLTLADVILTVTPEKKENTKIQPKGIYYIAEFNYTMADPKRTADLAELSRTVQVYRAETINESRNVELTQGYNVPQDVLNRLMGFNSIQALPAGNE